MKAQRFSGVTRTALAFFGWLGSGLLAGCGNSDPPLPPPLCDLDIEENLADEGQFHAPEGTGLVFATNPPNSGTHYPVWGKWGEHSEILGRGYYVHNMEHGAVVLLYRCDTPCPDTIAQLEQIMNSQPADDICFGTIKNRMILTQDPLLDVPVAAAAWRNIYRAPCVDAPSLNAFVKKHYGNGPEVTCSEGQIP